MLALEIRGVQFGVPNIDRLPVVLQIFWGAYQKVVVSGMPDSGLDVAVAHAFPDRGTIWIQMPDYHLDLAHFVITWSQDQGAWMVQDLSSLAGTKLDGVQLCDTPWLLTLGTEHTIDAGLCRFYVKCLS